MPDCGSERADAFADYYSVDLPDFPGWCARMRERFPALWPCRVVLAGDQDDLQAAIPQAHGVVIEELRVGEDELGAAPHLRIVHNFRTDMRNVDVAACARRGVPALPLERRVNVAVAEHAFALMIALAKKLCETNKRLTVEALRAGGWPARSYDRRHTANANWARISGTRNLFGSTLGLLGLGSIGRCLASRAGAFDMEILCHQRHRLEPRLEEEHGAAWVPLRELFARSEFVAICVPLNDSTRGMVGAEQLGAAERKPIVVNVARAEVVQREALLAALDSGAIGGVGMDVHYQEPGDPDDPFLKQRNAILTPHIAVGSRANNAGDMETLIAHLAQAIP